MHREISMEDDLDDPNHDKKLVMNEVRSITERSTPTTLQYLSHLASRIVTLCVIG